MGFTAAQLKQIGKIKKAFGKLRELYDTGEFQFILQVGEVNDESQGDAVAFNQIYISSGEAGDSQERILLTDDMVFTPETEQQHIFDVAKEYLEYVEEEDEQATENAPTE
jgi:hypothetical protein